MGYRMWKIYSLDIKERVNFPFLTPNTNAAWKKYKLLSCNFVQSQGYSFVRTRLKRKRFVQKKCFENDKMINILKIFLNQTCSYLKLLKERETQPFDSFFR